MDLRLISAILIGKTIGFFTKLTGGGATAAPGLYALKIDPQLVKKLTKNLNENSIVVSGTNGKTTTSRLIADILSTKFNIIHNRQGSNLLRGIASTLVSQSSLSGKIKQKLAIWEVDEATLPEALINIKPKIIVLLNLFRDQLDRYGEVDTVRNKWQKALSALPKDTVLIANADDPQIAYIAKDFKGKVVFFGINDNKLKLPEISHVADIRHCLNCDSKLEYQAVLSSHLGHYFCPNCNFKRPTPTVFTTNLKFNSDFSTTLKLTLNSQLSPSKKNPPLEETFNYNLPGLYNVYNILAATVIANYFKIYKTEIKKSIANFSAAFGRSEATKIQGKKAKIFLIKNPTGANEVLRVLALKERINLLIALNDNLADGRDISWIWDTNWEILLNKVVSVSVCGIRAWDMALRLKYANFKLSKKMINEDINYSLNFTVKNMDRDESLIILPTYTAMLEIQKVLSKTEKGPKWHED